MTRVLRRPMFRIGGSTEGITSGLAPRQGYAHKPGHVKQAPGRTNIYDFLISTGLNLASTPSQGGIFQQVATAAKDPFAQLQTRKVAQEEREWERGLHEEKMDFEREKFKEEKSQFKLGLEQDRYLGELEAQGEKQFIEDQIDAYWDPLIEAETDADEIKRTSKR